MYKFKLIYFFLKITGILWVFDCKLSSGKQHVVLCYHRITAKKFNQQLDYLNNYFNIIPLKTLLSSIFKNKVPQLQNIKKPSLSITMDDCFTLDFISVNQICQERKVHCTYFVPTIYMQNRKSFWSYRLNNFLSEIMTPCTIIDFENEKVNLSNLSEVKKFERKWVDFFLYDNKQTLEIEIQMDEFLSKNSSVKDFDLVIDEECLLINRFNNYSSFQSHTVTHPKLSICSEQELKYEFLTSKRILSGLSPNEEQYVICFPYGSTKHIGSSYITASNYYEYGVTLQSGLVSIQSNKMLIPRIGVYEHDNYQSIRVKVLFAQLRAII